MERLIKILKELSSPLRRIWPRLPHMILGMLSIGIVLVCLSVHSPGLAHFFSRSNLSNKYVALIEGLANPFRNRSLLLKSGLPVYDLKIGRREYAVLEEAVRQARKQGWMSDDLKVWTTAKFIQEGQEYDVKIRIRGDLPNHWEGPKKSWRIKFTKQVIEDRGQKVKEPIYFQGRHQINLIIPSDRDYVVAPFLASLMRDGGLVVPRDRFVVLRVNGRLQGLYYEVEHFDKPLLAAHDRPETTIFGQNDRAMHFEQYTKYGTPAALDARFDLGSVRELVEQGDSLALRAMQVLFDHARNPSQENFRRVRPLLDWEKYLYFRALTTLLNTNHVRFGSDNFRLYYDSSRGLFEPVPWDAHLVRMPAEPGTVDFWNSHGPDEIQRATLLDPELRLRRNRILWALVQDGGDGLMARFDSLHDRIRPLAWSDVLVVPIQTHKMDLLRSDLDFNVRRIHKVLSLSTANLNFRLEAEDRATLEVAANNFSGIQLQEIEISDEVAIHGDYLLYEDRNDDGVLDPADPLVASSRARAGSVRFRLDKYVLPAITYDGDTLDGKYWEYFDTLAGRCRLFIVGRLGDRKPQAQQWIPPQIQATAVNAVSGEPMTSAMVHADEPVPLNRIAITAYDATDFLDLQAIESSQEEFLKANPEFIASRRRPGSVEAGGRLVLNRTVIVPRGVELILHPGTDITMQPGSSLVCYGGLQAFGSVDNPIRIHGSNSESWGTLAVVRPPREVVLRHVEIRDGGQARINGILFTGGFAVHEGDLQLEDCRFEGMNGEDGVNLKNGRIVMRRSTVIGSASDAMDIDFGIGEIDHSQFLGSRNDGLDISGSRLIITQSRFENNGDKGLSVGESSHPVIVNSLFQGNQIGISSKDLSVAKVAFSTFVNNVLAIEAIRKKPMFGGGSAEFVNTVFASNQELIREDAFSRGGVTVQHSLADQTPEWLAGLSVTPVAFRSPQSGDFRLASEPDFEDAGSDFLVPPWVEPHLSQARPRRPGIFLSSLQTEGSP